MSIIKTITIDLASKGIPSVVDVMQGDSFTRGVKIKLYNGNVPYQYSDIVNASFSVAFEKPDGVRGWYDTLPNEEPAIEIDGENPSIVTAFFAPAMLEVVGNVHATLILRDTHERQLASFPFLVNVVENPAYGNQISNEYYSIKTFDEFYAKLLTSFISVEQRQDFTPSQRSQARQNLNTPFGDEVGVYFVNVCDKTEVNINAAGNYVLEFWGEYEQPITLRNIQDGTDDNDAATVRQVKAVDLTIEQNLTAAQKAQVRANIDAVDNGSNRFEEVHVANSFTVAQNASVHFNNNSLCDVGDPQQDGDAANKGYVDKAVANAILALPNLDEVSY